MSVIAWDGTTLAADRMTIVSGVKVSTYKLAWNTDTDGAGRPGKRLFGAVGGPHLSDFLRYMASGVETESVLKLQHDAELFCQGIEISASGLVTIHDRGFTKYTLSPRPGERKLPKIAAIGSGALAALGAMEAGATAERAVEIAGFYAEACGNGVDALQL